MPIIPNATIYQGDCLFPLKKASLSDFFPVINDVNMSTLKYAEMRSRICVAVIGEKSGVKLQIKKTNFKMTIYKSVFSTIAC